MEGRKYMHATILQAERLNLPKSIAVKLQGKKIEIIENEDNSILIKPVRSPIAGMRGMLKDSSVGTHTILEQKRVEKELEYGE